MKHKKSIVTVMFAIIVVFGGVAAYADDFVIDSFTIESEDGRRVFIYTSPFDQEYDTSLLATGVYYVTSSLVLIYLLEDIGLAFESDFVFSADLRHLAFIPTVSQDTAIEFYDSGNLLKSYRISDLISNMDAVSFSITMAFWEERAGRNFDSANNMLTLTTADNLTYVFDITTGEVITDGFQYIIPVVVGIGIVVCATVFFTIKNKGMAGTFPY